MIVTKFSCFAFLTYENKAFFECTNPVRPTFKMLGGKARHKEINHAILNNALDHWAAGHGIGGVTLSGFLRDADTCLVRELNEEAGIDIASFGMPRMANVYFAGDGHLVHARHVTMNSDYTDAIMANSTVDVRTAPINVWKTNEKVLTKKHNAIVKQLFSENADPSSLVVIGAQLEPLFV